VPLIFYGGGAVLTALVRGPGHAVRLVWVTFGALGIIYGGVTPVQTHRRAPPRARRRRLARGARARAHRIARSSSAHRIAAGAAAAALRRPAAWPSCGGGHCALWRCSGVSTSTTRTYTCQLIHCVGTSCETLYYWRLSVWLPSVQQRETSACTTAARSAWREVTAGR
jgi:hypothetical protein